MVPDNAGSCVKAYQISICQNRWALQLGRDLQLLLLTPVFHRHRLAEAFGKQSTVFVTVFSYLPALYDLFSELVKRRFLLYTG